jgi:hypothetical protein
MTGFEALGNNGQGSVLVPDGIFILHVAERPARKAYSLGGILPRAMSGRLSLYSVLQTSMSRRGSAQQRATRGTCQKHETSRA